MFPEQQEAEGADAHGQVTEHLRTNRTSTVTDRNRKWVGTPGTLL